jgi:D-psicose/D-tagatose/L-ribulose 3-epimerase
MKFGVHSFIWSANFGPADVPLLARIKEQGFDGVELPLFDPATYPVAEIRKGVEASGLESTVTVVIPNGMSIASEDAAVRQNTRVFLEDCVKTVGELGAKVVCGPMYTPVGYIPGRRRTGDEWKYAVECYRQLAPVCERHDVTMAIEPLNRFETYFFNTTADVRRFADEVDSPRIGLLVDTFHANIEEKDVAAAYRTAGERLKHVHISENDRGTPGSGHVDWAGVFQAIQEIGYDGWLTIESFGFSLGGISAAASIWRDLAPSPDDIAFEGVKFLKRQMGC